MKKIFILVITLISFSQAYAFELISIPDEKSVYQTAEQPCPISDDEFTQLEKTVFNKTFPKDNPQKRISRLEKEIFGMEQKGDYEDRFDNLLTASDYYKSGYRQGETIAQNQKQNVDNQKLNSKNYIQNYNFDTEPEREYFSRAQPQKYYDDFEPKTNKKQSKIKQFFSNLADILSAGVVTGYTPSINSYNYDPLDSFTTFGGSNFIGLPQNFSGPYAYGRSRYNPYYYNSYVPRRVYNGNYGYPQQRRIYHNHYPPHVRYNSGAGVRIIH